MKATDFRDMTFADLQGALTGLRRRAYEAWLLHGPGTTREVAARAGMDLLTFRPRTTELAAMELVEPVPDQPPGHEGVYRAVTMAEWQRRQLVRPRGPEQLALF
jgi:hypothetical protein